ncbi:hypothetical protein HDU83_003943 [Entophlyctis luteolus]|nr:hypothetical protein HDU83_003943 [Entophlyctis luteolus]KAJ3385239.1 hypothetical protein HDU84_002393 [Entophlyctis sp. JEL0112]
MINNKTYEKRTGNMTSSAYPSPTAPPGLDATIKRVYIIRHGETDANAAGVMQGSGIDLPLSAKGLRQAQALGARFSNPAEVSIDLIVVSTLQRTIQTAMEIKKFHPNARIVETADLREISWGIHEGKTATKPVMDLWRDWEDGLFDAKAEGGESPLEVETRSVPAFYRILRDAHVNEQNIAIVIHGRLIRILLASILRHDLAGMSDFPHANTCVNVLDAAIFDPERPGATVLAKKFVDSVVPMVGHAALGVDAVADSVPSTPIVGRSSTRKLQGAAAGSVNTSVVHPSDIVVRAVVLNDTTHLANL